MVEAQGRVCTLPNRCGLIFGFAEDCASKEEVSVMKRTQLLGIVGALPTVLVLAGRSFVGGAGS